jgi:ATP-dependent Clp protease ATP-binding subunit ClpC
MESSGGLPQNSNKTSEKMVLKPDDFTEQAQEVLGRSQEIVRRYQHSQWDVEHILMALLEQDKGVPVEILGQLGVSIPEMRDRLNKLLEQGPEGRVRVVPDLRGP